MSKQDMLKIQNNVLRVNIHCDGCKHKVKKTLQKIEGVYKVSIDVDQGKVTVSGNVDAATLIRKLEKSGKHAELWGVQKSSNLMNNQFKNMEIDNFKGQKDNQSQKGTGKDHQQKGGQQPSQQQMMPKGGQQQMMMPQKGVQQMMMPQKGGQQMMMPQMGGQQPSQEQMMMMMQHMKNMQNGGQQPSQQQMMMMQQMKDQKGPPKDQKSVKFNMHEDDESDDYDDDDFDSEFDDEEDYDDGDEFDDHHAPVDKKMQAKMMNGHASNDNEKIIGNGKHGPGKAVKGHGPTDISKNDGKKGGGGMAGMLRQLKGIGGGKDDKEGKGKKNGKGEKNEKGVNPNQGGKLGGGGKGKGGKNEEFGGKGGDSMGKNAFGGKIDEGFMMNKMPHGLQDINTNKKGGGGGAGGGNMGPMGNHPMEQMRNFPAVQGFPAGGNGGLMNRGGGYFQGTGQGQGQGPLHVNNPYNQQQYMAQMMMNQQRGYGGPEMMPVYAQPHPALMYGSPMPPPTNNFSHIFSDENTDSCSIM